MDPGPESQDLSASESPDVDVSLALTSAQLDWVGQQIFRNECAGRFQCLVHWNDGEAFPSLGIGHFIWYPKGVEGRFVESFPALMEYMEQRQVNIPEWLLALEPFDAPWSEKAEFVAVEDSPRLAELREFLAGTQGIQAEFIFRRARQSLGKIIESAPDDRKSEVANRVKALSQTPGGVYAIIDYVNFKGEGLSPTERYNDQGWGLLQVLLEMSGSPDRSALEQLREAAATVLTRRAENAKDPIERERWLPGWLKRLETYEEPPVFKISE
ncbi:MULTISPECIES: hypothetical protein [Marinobacter]|jgi:hypothetical protein|uniref:Uncharacterized protein n=2 Tax=Marinobacter TaxID=2742 RepID=A0A5M3Q479_9GAMM|nr:hypothetical protein [Marinobacter salsuginis]GBO90048.1 hypothetical protein MSSD14B_37160 [Marinobacter salsuginis]